MNIAQDADSKLKENKAKIKGFRIERELVRLLWRKGFAVIRGPASGARAKRIFYPDIVAMYKGTILVFEVKYRTKVETLYIPLNKVFRLREFAERAGGRAYLAVKIGDLRHWKIIPLDLVLNNVVGTNVRVDKELIRTAEDLDHMIEEIKRSISKPLS